ncbi:cobalt-precorrin 5A hydrolase [Sulfolobus sp. S-194]|uniref:cobalt-precorrin 5A hydrolase n=1 Tax=Sulfolobus sp. S-194 TaxID=2512240 RepID=UPI0014370A3A|nr:cobalt-precorrin 5A hydrolase [Sulfolobus sp. S-194]QIW24740.1 cobalt-precorrin 5A hydrolase [Sulfolobus sp. S-194]
MWRGIAIIYASKEDIADKLKEALRKDYPVYVFKYSEANFEYIWKCYDAIIFTMALSGAVRTICNYAKSKDVDPAVIVIDDSGRYVIPILGAHWGANDLALLISKLLDAEAIITTASENFGVTSVEEFSRKLFCKILNVKEIVKVTSALLRGEKVCVQGLEKIPEEVKGYVIGEECKYKVVLVEKEPERYEENTVYLKPYKLAIGIGSKIETDPDVIRKGILETLSKLNLPLNRVKIISSIREKVKIVADELGIAFRLVTRDEIETFNDECLSPQSEKLKEIGLKGVAEVSALIAGGNGAKLLLRKITYNNEITIAIAGFE